jgi:two-component system chemotaxis response regulator CheB
VTIGPGPIRVVVVEDSSVQRAHIVRTLELDGDITVVGQAAGAIEAIAIVDAVGPDVVTLDLGIPDGGGEHAIEQIMAHRPTPILVLSAAVTHPSSAPAVEALVAGAIEALPKPVRWTPADEQQLRARVRSLRGVTVLRHPRGRLARSAAARVPDHRSALPVARTDGNRVVAIAASTGGPAALAEVLSGLGGIGAPVLVIQHLHPDFVDGLVAWMERVSALPVKLARDGEALVSDTVYISPGGVHMRLAAERRIALGIAPATLHRPSANELFLSVARHAGTDGVGVLLSGMGDDGAVGLLEIRKAGGLTIAQDESTCAVYGMPRAAQRLGAVMEMLPLERISRAVSRATEGARS